MRQSLFSPLPSIVKIRFSWYTLLPVSYTHLRACFSSPEKGVLRNVSTMPRARFFPIMPAPIASIFASLCSLVSLAETVSAQSAQRTPFTLFATMEIPDVYKRQGHHKPPARPRRFPSIPHR